MLSAFNFKPFDLEPILAEWSDGPMFMGNSKKDPPVDEWLDHIKSSSVERSIPETCWHKVAKHFMGPKAKARLDELEQVLAKVNGGKYRWSWDKFRIAVASMGWTIEDTAMETIKIWGKSSGLWFMRKKENKEETFALESTDESQQLAPSNFFFWISKKPGSREETSEPSTNSTRLPAESSSWFSNTNWKEDKGLAKQEGTQKASPEINIPKAEQSSFKPPTNTISNTVESVDGNLVSTTTEVPVWLLNACNALDSITSEHPKAMSVVSAILIIAGSLPALPAITAGAGGAILASGTAHVIGVIAVGLGQALNTSIKNTQSNQAQATSTMQ